MKKFMSNDFLLNSETAKALFKISEKEPIFDYHCHLSPKEIYENKPFTNLSVLWLAGDHYKWRAMRNFGIDEKYITGESSGYEKYKAWAEVLPYSIGNPLYHWTHLELQRFFDIDIPLNPKTADEIWNQANKKIAAGGFRPREIIAKSNVAALCTTDDPADSLEYHELLARDKSFACSVLPAFRPDRALNISAEDFGVWVRKLSRTADIRIESFDGLKTALSKRLGFFVKMGCVASDHAFAAMPYSPASDAEVDEIFKSALEGKKPGVAEAEKYQTALMTHLASEYSINNIAMELHIGALRDGNTKMFAKLGPNFGFDGVDDGRIAGALTMFLDSLDLNGILPKTILFSINPKDNYVLGTIAGNFQSPDVKGKIQFGPAWWFSDHIDGMRRQMVDLASVGVLGRFIGMVTDSRSFLSYPRHEYFRRILCSMLGDLVENGEYPADMETLSDIVRAVSFENAKNYFRK